MAIEEFFSQQKSTEMGSVTRVGCITEAPVEIEELLAHAEES